MWLLNLFSSWLMWLLNLLLNPVFLIVFFLVLVLMTIFGSGLTRELNRAEREVEELEERVKSLEAKQKELEEERKKVAVSRLEQNRGH